MMQKISSDRAAFPIGQPAKELGDFCSSDFDPTGFTIHFIHSTDHPSYELGYDALWGEFGERFEMEQPAVIARRFSWQPERPIQNRAMLYEMVVMMHHDQPAAVQDQTAIVDLSNPLSPVTVHLSHLLVMPQFRGRQIAGWMSTMAIHTARQCLDRANQHARPFTLVGEVEPADKSFPERFIRLKSFEKSGFAKVDPKQIHYLQPDFRPPEIIDQTHGPTPLPLSLIIRQDKQVSSVSSCQIKSMVTDLYEMYAQTFRMKDMISNWASLQNYPADDQPIRLIPPTQTD